MVFGKDREALVVLLELTRELTDNEPLETSLQAVTEAALRLVPGDHASIRLLDGTHTEILSGARAGSGHDLSLMEFQRGEGLSGWVVQHAAGIHLGDAPKDPRFKAEWPDAEPDRPVRSIILEPLWSAGKVIGVLSISSPDAQAFTSHHQLLVRLLANCCTPPIERARLRRLALTDDLTLAFNHRYLSVRFGEEIERARRSGAPLAALLMDLDHFKRVNDRHGHATGDEVLRTFADRVRAIVRRSDVFVRRGGEEFVLVMPGSSGEQARNTAERIRRALHDAPFSLASGRSIRQTVSIGVATWDREETAEALEGRADAAMYHAKQLGRDRVAAAEDAGAPAKDDAARAPDSGP